MKRIALIIAAVIFSAAASTARAQSTDTKTQKSAVVESKDSVSIADVQRAADQLARTVQAVAKKVTEDPQLKVAALRLATESVNAAQIIVTSQADMLQTMLDALAKEVAAASVKIQQDSKSKSH